MDIICFQQWCQSFLKKTLIGWYKYGPQYVNMYVVQIRKHFDIRDERNKDM